MILAHLSNTLEKELIKLFHSSGLPLHFNKTGNKQFINYQRISLTGWKKVGGFLGLG